MTLESRRKQLKLLENIAALVRDSELQKLANVSRQMQETSQKIAALSEVDCGAQLEICATLTAEKHDLWRFQKRIELNTMLARQTAIYLAQHDVAARAFGRAATLERLARK